MPKGMGSYGSKRKQPPGKQKLGNTPKNKAKKRQQIQEYKKMMGCSKCGYNENPDILHFHHIDPRTKVANISRMVGKNHSMKRIKEEINKCRLLCITCHHKEHGIK